MAVDFDQEFQRRVVALLLRHRDHAKRIADMLDPAWLEDTVYADVADVAASYVKEFGTIPTKHVLREECGEEVTRSELFRKLYKVDLTDAEYIIKHFASFCRQRAVQRAIIEAAKTVKSGGVSDSIVKSMQQALMVGEDVRDVGTSFHDTLKARAKEYERGTNYSSQLRTGWQHVDRLIGGLSPGELGIIMAPTNGGKSYGLMDLGYNWLTRVDGTMRVLHVTCEMSERKTLARYDRRVAGKRAVELFKTMPDKFSEILRRNVAMNIHGDMIVKGYPSKMSTANKIIHYVEMLKTTRDWYPDAILVDYLDELRADTRQREKRDELAEIARDLRRMAGVLRVPVWSATQTNRASLEKEVITMADVAESFEKMHVADVVLAFCRTPQERTENRMRIFVAKARDARAGGLVSCEFNPEYGRIVTQSINEEVTVRTKKHPSHVNSGTLEQKMRDKGRDTQKKSAV